MQKGSKLNIQIAAETLLLLAVTLSILAYFSHKVLHQEALRNMEQKLEGTVQDIDNILLSVEQSAGNVYFDLVEHLDNPDRMYTYSRKLVESNANIVGCAIAFKPGYYPGKDLFMAYVHRQSSSGDGFSQLVTSETFANRPYTEQIWYTKPMDTGWIGWTDPLKGSDTEDEPLVTYCLPFTDKTGERVGEIAVDVSINQLSKIILAAKPSPNGYSLLLAHNGSYMVHPDEEKLTNPTIFSQQESDVDSSETAAARAMLAGESGMKEFRRDHANWWVFYKPFKRAEWEGRPRGNVGWSVGLVCPESDIFGTYNFLLFLVVALSVIGLLLFFMLGNWIFRRQLKPLNRLIASAQHITEGNYYEPLPHSDRQDEIGQLQHRFGEMQHSLQHRVDDLENERTQLQQHVSVLRAAYDNTVETDKIKTSFLHYMTNQMYAPSKAIDGSVTTLCNNYQTLTPEETSRQVDNIQRKSQTIVELLGHMAHLTKTETGKEVYHE